MDLSVSTEEWDTRKRSRAHRNIVRLTSLQAQKRPPPIFRQSSTPMILENRHVPPRYEQLFLSFKCIHTGCDQVKNLS